VLITRTYIKYLNSFYTTSFSILKNKEQANKYRNNTKISSKNFHCDFEKGISNTVEKIFPNINIKYCICTLKEH